MFEILDALKCDKPPSVFGRLEVGPAVESDVRESESVDEFDDPLQHRDQAAQNAE